MKNKRPFSTGRQARERYFRSNLPETDGRTNPALEPCSQDGQGALLDADDGYRLIWALCRRTSEIVNTKYMTLLSIDSYIG